MRYLLLASLTCCVCFGQSLVVGVVGGGRATDDVTSLATPESRRYIVGPMLEIGLPLGLGVEVDALYHRQGYLIGASNVLSSFTESERANSWEFPLLLKYKLPVPKLKPFVEVGIAPRTIVGDISTSGVSMNVATGQITPFSTSSGTAWSASFGIVAGGGVQFGLGPLRLAPEVRYTHWTTTPINVSFGDGPSFSSTQEQLDVLIGIGFNLR